MSADTNGASGTSPGGRSMFNDAMSPRPSQIALPTPTEDGEPVVDMNKILREKITSPTHMRRFDSADYFMERDFPPSGSDEEGRSRRSSDSGGGGGRASGRAAGSGAASGNSSDTGDSGVHAELGDLDGADHNGDAERPQHAQMKHAPLQRKKPPMLETRWASHTTRPAEVALNSPHPAGPRALKRTSITDAGAQGEPVAEPSPADSTADMNALLRAKLAGKSRLRRFDSADYFLNHETGRLQQRGPQTSTLAQRRAASSGIDVSPIKSLAISTNVGSRSRGNSPAAGGVAVAAGAGAGSARKTPLRGVIPSPNRLHR